MIRQGTALRHITQDGLLKKVEKQVGSVEKFFIKGTDIELTLGQVTHKRNITLTQDGKKFKVKRNRQKRESYDSWWNQSNLDGSFAYNGVTDDF